MSITALALLRMPKPNSPLRADALADCVLFHSELDFALEPEELTSALAEQLGAALLAHDDPRGIFFIPSVASPQAQSYEAVIAEVGEGGAWAPSPASLVEEPSDLGALLGGMLAQLPPGLAASAQAAMSGDQAALAAMGAQVQSLLGGSPALEQLLSQLTADEVAQSPLQEMVQDMQEQLMSDPSKLDQLMQQMFGAKKK